MESMGSEFLPKREKIIVLLTKVVGTFFVLTFLFDFIEHSLLYTK